MQFTAEHDAFRASVRKFVEDRINPNADEWEKQGMMPLHQIFKEMSALGMLGLEYDPTYGGQGADHSFTTVLGEEAGRADLASFNLALGVQIAMATPSLAEVGSDELKQEFLTPALQGEQVCSIAVTEPDAGSDVAAIRTTARRDGGDWVINGSKMYITNGVQADWVCLLARTSDDGGHRGMTQIVVPTSTPGFSVARKLDKYGMRASDTGLLSFDDVRVPVRFTIGDEGRGFQQQMHQFIVERAWGIYPVYTACERALQRTRDYAHTRNVFGGPLSKNQYLQYTYAELAAEVDMLKHYAYTLADTYMAGGEYTRMATIAKLKAGRVARQVGDWCLQVHGGIGYMEETWTARFVRDHRIVSIGGGADEVMLRVLSQIDGWT